MSNAGTDTTSTIARLLTVLQDGEFHSGESLGAAIGVSRAAIWKAVARGQTLGLPINRVKGRGYQISGGLQLLDHQAIIDALPIALAEWTRLDVFSLIDSTNAFLLNQNSIHGRVCISEYQSQGRGRRGRQWVSPFGQNIYLSLGYQTRAGLVNYEALSLAIGVVLLDRLAACGIKGLRLKWPNDILFGEAKVGGILVEMRGDPMGDLDLVVGIGLNYAFQQQSGLAGQIDQPWSDLYSAAKASALALPSRNLLVAGIIESVFSLLSDYPDVGFAGYHESWLRYAAHIDQVVGITQGNLVHQGIMRGITSAGNLLLEISGELREFRSGDVSLRLKT